MTVIPLPRHGQWAWDLRGQGRGVRVSAHADEGLLNVSLWREGTCVGTAQLLPADVAKLVSGLSEGLAEIAAQPPLHAVEPNGPERIQELERRLSDVESRLGTPAPRTASRFAGVVRAVRALQHPQSRRNTRKAGDGGQSGSSAERARTVATVAQTAATTSTPTSTSSRFRP
jgi:hypothetical protein